MKRIVFSIVPIPPLRLDLTVWALRRRPTNLMDCWDGNTFRRVLGIDGKPVEISVQQDGPSDRARLLVSATARDFAQSTQTAVKNQMERMLGLRRDLSPFYQLAKRDPKLARLADEFRGLKPPRFPTLFEGVANGVACQQLSLLVGILLLGRLAGRYGQSVANRADALHSFPGPEDLSRARTNSLRELGFSGRKAEYLLALASKQRQGNLGLEKLEYLDNQAALEFLQTLPGIGRWTAEYILLRSLGRLDVFPGDDVGARNNLARFLGRPRALDYEGVRRAVSNWQPYAGFVYFHLLLAGIRDAGWMKEEHGKVVGGAALKHNAA